MTNPFAPSYVPALRMKAGELAGLRDLAPDVADRILPRLIVPPPEERDHGLQAQLFETANEPNVADALAAHWRGRSVLVEATHLFPDFGVETAWRWLPNMFARARRADVPAIPLVNLTDLTTDSRDAYRAACADGPVQLGIAVLSGELVSRDSLNQLMRHLEAMQLSPANCSIIVDFADADFTHAEIVAPVIGNTLEMVQESALWGHVVFQGTNYPDTNPAEGGGRSLVRRNEWMAWRQAVRFDPATSEQMIFGDYAADCAVMKSRCGRPRPIPHYRYTTPDAWLVQRGSASTSDAVAMRDVSRSIVNSGLFAGRSFSWADEYIFTTAHGFDGPGNATTWRAVNTNHHITRVVADIGGVRGFALQRDERPPPPVQEDLFTAR